jgi:hypothetical protein
MYWGREIAGWLLVLLGLGFFYLAYGFFQEPMPGVAAQYWAGFATSLVGIIVFRGGIHLLKVSIAARICARADERLYPAVPKGEGPRPTPAKRPAPGRGA